MDRLYVPQISLRTVVFWVCAVFGAKYLASGLRELIAGSTVSYGHLANFGIFQLFAWFAVVIVLRRTDKQAQATSGDTLFLGLCSVSALLPNENAAWVGLSLFGGFLLVRGKEFANLRAAGAIIVALVTQLLWGRIFFESVAYQIEKFDAAAAAELMTMFHRAVTLQGNLLTTATHRMVIYDSCTSFHNISVALLCSVTASKLWRNDWVVSDLWTGSILIFATIAFNSLRLSLMATSAAGSFDYWHTGTGSAFINAGLSISIVLVSLWGAEKGRHKSCA